MAGALMRWDPFSELADVRSRFDRLFRDLPDGSERTWMPAIDVVRKDSQLLVRADIPGIKPEEVKIQVEDDILTISGEHEERAEEQDRHYVRRERRYGSFQRSIALPDGVEADKIKATTHDGVIEVSVPLPEKRKREPVTITPSAG